MKVTLPESAIKTLKDILKDNQERPQNIRVYFAGMGCSGASFGIALDEEREDDVHYDIEGLHFIKSEVENSNKVVHRRLDFFFSIHFLVLKINCRNRPAGAGHGLISIAQLQHRLGAQRRS